MKYIYESREGLSELIRFRRSPLAYMAQASRRGVDVRHLRAGSRRFYQVNHPDLIRDVLVTHDWNLVKGRGLQASRPVLGNGLLTSEGEPHRHQRRLIQPAFHHQRLASYADTMIHCAAEMSDSWSDGDVIDVHGRMMELTLRIVGKTLFSADLTEDAGGIEASLHAALSTFLTLNDPLVQLFPPLRLLAERTAKTARARIAATLQKVIEEHRREPSRYDDMLSMLLRSHNDNNVGFMSDELLLDECLTLFLAGHETTANALTWTLYLLNRHPDEAEKVSRELLQVLEGRLPRMDEIASLPITASVFKESLRLYPPAWIMSREALTPYLMGEVQIPAGATLLLSPYAMHRDERFWNSAESFLPSRWQNPHRKPTPYSYFPFGAGTRICVGEHFAMMEGVLLLATMLRRCKFSFLAPDSVRPWPQLTLRPSGRMLVRVTAVGGLGATSRVM